MLQDLPNRGSSNDLEKNKLVNLSQAKNGKIKLNINQKSNNFPPYDFLIDKFPKKLKTEITFNSHSLLCIYERKIDKKITFLRL